jgi:signal transduction histidine kinase
VGGEAKTGAVSLRIIEGRGRGETYTFQAGTRVLLGRDDGCDVQLMDEGISRSHCRLDPVGGGHVLIDLQSTNGTFVNGEKVGRASLSSGDVIRVGQVRIVFEKAGTDEGEPAAREVDERSSSQLIRKRFETTRAGMMKLSVLEGKDQPSLRMARHLDAIYRVSGLVHESEDLDRVLEALVAIVRDVFGSERCYLVMREDHGVASRSVVNRDRLEEVTMDGIDVSSNIVDEALDHGQSVLTTDAMQDERYSGSVSVMLHEIRSVICVPIESGEGVIGAIYVDSTSRPAAYFHDDLELLAAIGKQAGMAIQRAVLIRTRRDAERALGEKEQEIRQLQKMEAVGRLAGGVAHDFNNLLGVILGYCDVALQEMGGRDPTRECVSEIHAAAERARELTQQLLAFSRRQVMQKRVFELNDVVSSTERMLGRILGEDVTLVTRLSPDAGRVKADTAQMQQVLLNLAVNARDAMPDGGSLIVETRPFVVDGDFAASHVGFGQGDHVLMIVSDTGVGMDAETRSRAFEPFFTTKPEGKGTGLGLSTVYGVIKQSGGEVRLYSEPGKGTSFKIYLPRVTEDAVPIAESRPSPPSVRGTETVLVVEDDVSLLALTGRMIRKHGYRVLEATSGESALALMESYAGEVHLLLADVILPGMSGPELAGRLPELKVLFMSGHSDETVLRQNLLPAEVGFIQKPFTADEVCGRIREILGTV